MPLSPKSRLGTYEILGPLGTGGMGEVYRAKDLRLGREVAIKVLPSEVASTEDRLARFEREARTVAGLNHPSIVTLYSVEDEDGVRFLTMEMIEGQTLSSHVVPGGLPLSRVLELSIPITDALVAAHERGVIHRDLKPANVMVTRQGRVKVLDFGLATTAGDTGHAPGAAIGATVDSPISGTGQVLGTAPYMAPEQIRGEAVDARTDLFALGIILYELATGHRPFKGKTPADVGSSILRDTPEPITRVRKDLPKELEHLVSRCLEKNPRERVQSAIDVSNELRRLKRELERVKPDPSATASIAVLPFVNRSASAEDEYFSDGLADELLNVLAKIKGLRVSARTSSFHFKGKDATIAEIGSALQVATVLEGSVRKAGNRVRISVQLVKVSDGYHLWSETYDRTLDDIFAVQDDIAQSVMKELRTALLGEEADSDASGQARAQVANAVKGRATDPEAYRLYLLAQHHLDHEGRESLAKAREYLNEALARDPKFALAWTGLSRMHYRNAGLGWAPFAPAIQQARDAVHRALALEPELAEAHAGLAAIQTDFDRDWAGAEASIARALTLAPGNPVVLQRAGGLKVMLGRVDEGIALYRRALERDPLSSSAYRSLGLALYNADRMDEAEAALRKSVELAPRRILIHTHLSFVLAAQGRVDEAVEEAKLEPDPMYRLWGLAIVHATGNRGEWDKAVRELIENHSDDGAYQIAEVYAACGEIDKAFEWLERAHAQGDAGISYVKFSRNFRPIHGDPRWRPFLKKIRLDA